MEIWNNMIPMNFITLGLMKRHFKVRFSFIDNLILFDLDNIIISILE